MKLTESKLRDIIREELSRLNEAGMMTTREWIDRFVNALHQEGAQDVRAPRENELEADGQLIEIDPKHRDNMVHITIRGSMGDRHERVIGRMGAPREAAKEIMRKL